MPIRQAGPADAPAILALTRAAYAKWVPLIGREPKPMQADYAAALRHHRIHLLEQGGLLLGLVETIAEPDHLLVENLAIHPDHQRQGLGRQLLAHAEALAHQQGFSQARLYTNAQFSGNVALYQSCGWRIDRQEPFKGGLAVHMSKPLLPPFA